MSEGRLRLQTDGFAIVADVVPMRACKRLLRVLAQAAGEGPGLRELLRLPAVSALADALKAQDAIAPLLPADAVAVQCTLFAKEPGRNWSVGLHQDLSIPVAARVDAAECAGWSNKDGVRFTQPPSALLDELVALRVQLDPDRDGSGALQVVPGSHRRGRLPMASLSRLRLRSARHTCTVPQGGVLAMKPLLAHASGKATSPLPRRVLHFLFGPRDLPFGLAWAHAV
jgi:ectoine hydroxylase-related dioxygenase (phytanoyl-CoA dioxygenase family)